MTFSELTVAMVFLIMLILCSIRVLMELPQDKRQENKNGIDKFETGMAKTIGNREIQEDEYGVQNFGDGIMAVLADGHGKLHYGRVASLSCVKVFQDIFKRKEAFYNPQYYFRQAFRRANREVLRQLADSHGTASVGAVLIRNHKLYYAVVGNIRIAVYRNHELVPVSVGHTIDMLAQQRYYEGKITRQETIELLEQRRLYNFVGRDGFRDIEVFDAPIVLREDDYVLLMSDGVYETVRWRDMEECLSQGGGCQLKAENIIKKIEQSGQKDKDNACVIVMQAH